MYIDVVMPMFNLIEYSYTYWKTLGSLWQYYRNKPALTDASTLDNFPSNSASCKFKQKIMSPTGNNGIKNVKIMVP